VTARDDGGGHTSTLAELPLLELNGEQAIVAPDHHCAESTQRLGHDCRLSAVLDGAGNERRILR